MVDGAFPFAPAAGDFRLQRDDPRIQLGHGKRVKVLPRELRDGIVRSARKFVVHHRAALTLASAMSITARRNTGAHTGEL